MSECRNLDAKASHYHGDSLNLDAKLRRQLESLDAETREKVVDGAANSKKTLGSKTLEALKMLLRRK